MGFTETRAASPPCFRNGCSLPLPKSGSDANGSCPLQTDRAKAGAKGEPRCCAGRSARAGAELRSLGSRGFLRALKYLKSKWNECAYLEETV